MAQNRRSQRLVYDCMEFNMASTVSLGRYLEFISNKQKNLLTMKNEIVGKKFRTQYNAAEILSKYERNNSPSMTVPDQTMSLREILRRYAQGLGPRSVRVPIYNPDDDMPDPATLDLAEREELMDSVKQEILSIKEKVYPKKTQPEAPAAAPSETTKKSEKTDEKSTNNP